MKKLGLLLRGGIPLALVGLALVGLPTLAAWWLMGGPLGWRHLLVGALAGAGLLGLGGLALGWALGRRLKK